MSEFVDLETWAHAMISALSPVGRRRLQVQLARDLRRSQAARIGAQQNPDGSSFEARKADAARFRARDKPIRARAAGRKDGQPMFRKIRGAAHLRAGVDADGVWAGFAGRVARIALVHQEGEVDQVYPDGPRVRYPQRVLLGFTDAERQHVLDAIATHLDV
jgi:phage virion morphogenesis protein